METRPPIVCVLGHVDHGKTSLLDAIRKTNVAKKEAGGITQSIGASKVTFTSEAGKDKTIVFIDTPGHAAFSAMRGRGANVADIAILVVAADDGVAPQTKEAIALIREAKIPFIAALTKIDLPSASKEAVLGQLEKEEVYFEGRGGDAPYVAVSAKTGEGIPELLEMISLVAEMNDIQADPDGPLEAVIIESFKDKRGSVATAVVRNGTMRQADTIFVEGKEVKVRAMFGWLGGSVKEAKPGDPVQIIGFEEVPPVGSTLSREAGVLVPKARREIQKVKEGEIAIFLKALTAGSLEAILASLPPQVVVISSGIGDVNESDVLAAKSSGASVFVFESKIAPDIARLADQEGVHIERHDIIYELIKKLEETVKKGQAEVLGRAEIVAIFPFNNKKVAGCKVLEGRIAKVDNMVVTRENKEVGKVKAVSIKRQKTEIPEAKAGEEFGIIFEPQLDFKAGDVLLSVAK